MELPGFDDHQPPVWGVMHYARDGASLIEIPPAECPRGHRLEPGQLAVGWSPARRSRCYTCETCYADDPATASWCPAPSPVPEA